MRNKFEHILLTILLGLSVLLGLSFWLNINYRFNLFCKEHWDILSKLQATQSPINPHFYISIAIAIFIFLIGMVVIFIPKSHQKNKNQQIQSKINAPIQETKTPEPAPQKAETPGMPYVRPARLNLPKNISAIAAQKQAQRTEEQQAIEQTHSKTDEYNKVLSEIFTENGYIVKPNPTITGFTPNLFAIGSNEALWIGAIDCEIDTMKKAVEKLQTVFHDTLEDIEIHINPFIIDTKQKLEPNSEILVAYAIEDLRTFISENPSSPVEGIEQDNFNAYSEYIDTIIQYIKNI